MLLLLFSCDLIMPQAVWHSICSTVTTTTTWTKVINIDTRPLSVNSKATYSGVISFFMSLPVWTGKVVVNFVAKLITENERKNSSIDRYTYHSRDVAISILSKYACSANSINCIIIDGYETGRESRSKYQNATISFLADVLFILSTQSHFVWYCNWRAVNNNNNNSVDWDIKSIDAACTICQFVSSHLFLKGIFLFCSWI